MRLSPLDLIVVLVQYGINLLIVDAAPAFTHTHLDVEWNA